MYTAITTQGCPLRRWLRSTLAADARVKRVLVSKRRPHHGIARTQSDDERLAVAFRGREAAGAQSVPPRRRRVAADDVGDLAADTGRDHEPMAAEAGGDPETVGEFVHDRLRVGRHVVEPVHNER